VTRTATLLLCALFSVTGRALAQASQGDEWLKKPVDDKTFQAFLPFFAYDKTAPFEVKALEKDVLDGIPREHLSYLSTPGQRVTARIYHAAGSAGRQLGWIVFLHGGGASGKDGPGNRFLASFFARSGWSVLSIDMQYFGERQTDLLTQFTEGEKHDRLYNQPAAYLAFVAQTVKDAGRALDYLVKERAADPKRIALVGFSRGAQLATIVGGADKRFVAVGLLYDGHFDALETNHLAAACPANYIGRISPRPLLMVNGTQDTDFYRDVSVLPLQKLARNPKLMLWAETGHSVPPADMMPQITKWLEDNVK
jgi:acetyl esterase/lipase